MLVPDKDGTPTSGQFEAFTSVVRSRRRLVLSLAIPLAILFYFCLVSKYLYIAIPSSRHLPNFSPRNRTELEILYRDTFHSPPRHSLDRNLFDIAEASTEHTVTAILVHGLGDSPKDLPFVSYMSVSFPYIKWVSLTAHKHPVTVRGGTMHTSWFDIITFHDLYQGEDLLGMLESQRAINEIIEEERAELVSKGKDGRIVVAGFSQGAIMTLLAALTAETPLTAAICLSAYLPLARKAGSISAFHPRDTPIFWAHGAVDPWLLLRHAANAVSILRNPPWSMPNIDFRVYPNLGHVMNEDEMRDLIHWLHTWAPAESVADTAKRKQQPSIA